MDKDAQSQVRDPTPAAMRPAAPPTSISSGLAVDPSLAAFRTSLACSEPRSLRSQGPSVISQVSASTVHPDTGPGESTCALQYVHTATGSPGRLEALWGWVAQIIPALPSTSGETERRQNCPHLGVGCNYSLSSTSTPCPTRPSLTLSTTLPSTQ